MIKLVVQSGPIQGQVFMPPPGIDVEIGRGEGCFVCIDGPDVSRKHAVLVPRGVDYVIQDLDSTNGTFVNGKMVQDHVLRSGDTIRIGKTDISFVLEEKDPWVGRTLGGCRILESIGRGGMGTVYRAHQIAMDRTVALKILSEELGRDETFVAGFVREARAMAKLSHANVVQVHNVGTQDGAHYLSMEYVEGGTVKELMGRDGQLPPRRAVEMTLDASQALVWAEQHGIVHRDIKPGNLLLDPEGRVKVADFGLASDLTRQSTSSERGRIVGSPPYMAPEQARGEAVDHRADIYALGSTLYAILTGRSPFRGRTVQEVLSAKLSEDPTPVWTLAPDSPRRLCEIVAKCMERKPEKRYQHAAELLRELNEVRASFVKSGARTDGSEPARGAPTSGSAAPRSRSRKFLWTIGAATLVGAGLGVVVAIQKFGHRPEPADPPAEASVTVAGSSIHEPDRSPEAVPSEAVPSEAVPPGTVPGNRLAHDSAEDPATDPESGSSREGVQPDAATVPRELDGLLGERIPGLLVESRFERAIEELEAFLQDHPQTEKEIAVAFRLVRSAETLFSARKLALELQGTGDLDGAVAALKSRLDELDEPHRLEALAAIESIQQDKTAPPR